MLTLDSLELIGFKSFAKKATVQFGDRVTALVGPNGCGKSNLADAVGWVLGAQQARNVRGQRIEDVIFAGTEKRKASGVAEVRLRFRVNGGTPIVLNGEEFCDETLEISRKAYRTGEHFYLINQRRCRLRDIQQLFEDAGLGFASYALIAQGRIESFLTAKPLDRRALIEEAARVTGYKSRRRSAELKLEMAQQNLLRVNDIITEVERQLRSLKRQAAKARRYRRFRDEFRTLQAQRLAVEFDRLHEKEQQVAADRERLETQHGSISRQLEECQQGFEQARRRREEAGGELEELQRRHSQLQLETDRCENRIRHHGEQLEVTEAFLESNAADQLSLQESLSKIDDEEKLFALEREAVARESGHFSEAVERQQKLADECRAQVEEAERRLDELRSSLVQLSAESAMLGNTSEQLSQRSQGVALRLEQAAVEQATCRQRLKETRRGQQKQLSFLETGQKQVDRLRGEVETLEEARRELEQRLNELTDASHEARATLVGSRERLQSLQELELSRSQYSEDVQSVLGLLGSSERVKTVGTLADSLDTSPQFERLVEEYLGRELEYILVDSLDDAVGGLTELKTQESGRCTFLTLRTANGFGKKRNGTGNGVPKADGVFGRLSDLLEMQGNVREALCRALPRQAEAIVVSDIDRAMGLAHSYPESTFVTLEGEALTPRGLLSVTSTASPKTGLLAVKRQRRELEKKIARQQKAVAGADRELARIRTEFQTTGRRLEDKKLELTQAEKDVIARTHMRDQQAAELQRHTQALDRATAVLEELEQEAAETKERAAEVAARLEKCEAARQESESLLAGSLQNLTDLRSQSTTVSEELNRIRSDFKVMQERDAALERTLARIDEQRVGLRGRLEGAAGLQASNEERLVRLRADIEDTKRQRCKLRAEAKASDDVLAAAREQFAGSRQQCRELEASLESLRRRETQFLEQRSGLDVRQARCETRLGALEEQCREQLSAPLEEVCSGVDRKGIDIEAMSRRYEELRLKLEKFGPINMTALEEYQEHEERHRFLAAQKTDIETSIRDTTRAISEINRRSRRQFQEAFEAINGHFNVVFQKLFGGGECGMRLLDPDDILECGIDVFAQPPGKRLQNVMLLSGGEKTLTVFALLVALFLYRPSRFCVLDEVDAPLDDANVTRFASLLGDLSAKTQFIVITHNKQTMEKANRLFGVTMEEAGVSKVVSVQFD